jgi:site-specific DNA-methyltransferase (adenine-specific)
MKREDIQIKFVDIDLCEYNNGQIPGVPENPRTREDKKQRDLQKSIEELPEMTIARAALCFMHDGHYVVIGGNRRLEAQRALQRKEVPIIELPKDTPVEKLRRIALLDNESTGETDWAKVAKEWNVEEIKAWNISAPKGWFDKTSNNEAKEDEYEANQEAEPIVKYGQIWQLGNHKLMCGDSTKPADVELLMGEEKADMVFTDPPYGVSYEGGHNQKKKKQIKNDALVGDVLYEFLKKVFLNIKSYTKSKSGIYVFYAHSNTRQFINAFYDSGLKQRSIIVWHKIGGGFGDFMAQYMNAYEPCIYGSNGDSVNWYGANNEKTIWEIYKEKKCDLHPTMKPIKLVQRAVKNSSTENDLVLDLFGGSGSTIITCEQINRRCYTMELDPHYCDVIISRWEKLTGGASP